MPYILSEQEKTAIRERYLDNVRQINQYLPDRLKIPADLTALNKRLDDPKEQRLYKKGLELKQREDRRAELYDRLGDANEYLRAKGKDYTMDRVISYKFDMSGDPNAAAYNENVVRNYYLHPEAMAQQTFGKVFQFDPSVVAEIAKSDDMGNLLMDYYEQNTETCEFAYVLKGGLSGLKPGVVDPKTKKSLESSASCYEVLSAASEMVKSMSMDSFFAMPTLTEEQQEYLMGTDIDVEKPELHESMRNAMRNKAFRNNSDKQFKMFFKKAQEKGYDVHKIGAFNHMVAKVVKNGKEENVAFVNALEGQFGNSVQYVNLSDAEAAEVADAFDKDYIQEENFVQHDFVPANPPTLEDKMKVFRLQYAATCGLPMHRVEGMNLRDVLARHKGGFFERTFGTTSREYKAFEAQVNRYTAGDNAASNEESLVAPAQAYLQHKGVHTIADALRLDATGKGRALLCLAVVGAFGPRLRNLDHARDYVQVPPRPLQEQQVAPVDAEKQSNQKEPAIPDKSMVEDKPPVQVDVVVKQAEPMMILNPEVEDPKV